MTESQHIEWKTSWRDEYLKWICGFANAQAGVLEIGRSDQGKVLGLKDARSAADILLQMGYPFRSSSSDRVIIT